MSKTALLALRDSTDNQDVQRQREAGHAYAIAHGISVVHEVVDYISGIVPIFDRPGGREILEWVAQRKSDAIIFDTIGRVAREEHPVSTPMLRSALAHAGMELHYCDKGRADLTPYGGIIDYIGAVQAGEERKNILRQTNEGKLTHVRAGSVLVFRDAPYGYISRSEQRQPPGFDRPFRYYWLEVDEAEARIVRLVFGWYVRGEWLPAKGNPSQLVLVRHSLDAIAQKLTAMDAPTRSDTRPGYRPRKLPSGMWSTSMVRNMMRRETYVGAWHYRKTETVRAPETKKGYRQIQRPRSEWLTVDVPAILVDAAGAPDISLFQAAQKRLVDNKELSPRNLRAEYLLRSRVRCARCGHAAGGPRNHAGHRKYRCTHKKSTFGAAACDLPNFDGEALESVVWSWVRRVVTDRDYLRQLLDELNRDEAREAAIAAARQRLAEVRRDIETLDRAAKGLLELLSRADNAFTPNQINAQQKENRRRLDGLRDEQARLQTQINNLTAVSGQVALFEETAGRIKEGVLMATEDDKRSYVEQLDVRVRLNVEGAIYKARLSCALFEEGREITLNVPHVGPGRYSRRALTDD